MSTPHHRVSNQPLDVILKLEAEGIARLLEVRFGVAVAPVRHQLPTELPQLDLHMKRLDIVFELEDDTLLHLEFQSRLTLTDLERFVSYGMALLRAYAMRPAHTVVICGPAVRSAPRPMDFGDLPYRLTSVLIGDADGDAVLDRLRALVAHGRSWTEGDRVDLILSPLMRHTRAQEEVIREGLRLALALPESDQKQALGTLLGLAYHYIGEDVLAQLWEEITAMGILEKLLEDTLEERVARAREAARTEGRQEGRTEGREEGRTEGREEGRTEGREEGHADAARGLALRLLALRFGAPPPGMAEYLAAIADTERLDALVEAAAIVGSIEDFSRLLNGGHSG